MKKNKKVILAFSGGLDTSFCVLWLKKQGFDVVTLTVDTGGFSKKDTATIAKQSKVLGAIKHYFVDGKKDLYEKIVTYIIKGNVLRGGVYPLSAGSERLIIAEKLVQIATIEKADAVSHGSTGAGNDQIRFDVALNVLIPKIKHIAPIRELQITREKELEFLKEYNIEVPLITKSYSVNKGMLGITIGGKETKGSWENLPEEVYGENIPISKTPNKPFDCVISFEKGLPKKIDGESMTGVAIINFLTAYGNKHGVGKGIHLGDTILGMKGRVAFSVPAILILIKAHTELEKLVQTKWQAFWKNTLCQVYGNFLHEALYFDPVMKDIEAFINSSQKVATGDVKVKLFKGNIIINGVKSPYSLINPDVAIYGEENEQWSGRDAEGFGKIYGLQSVLAQKAKKKGDGYEKNQN